MDLRDSRRELAELTREAEEELPKEVRLRGWVREDHGGYELYRPVSLPHTRRPLNHEMVIGVWMIVTVGLVVLGAGMVWYIACLSG